MRRFHYLLLLFSLFLFSCEKETILSVSQSSINIPDAGGSQSITLTANKPWTASSNQSWCKVSPSSGEEATNSRITITCDANTTYDERSCTVTFTCAEMTSSVNVTQATNNGLLVSQKEYNISNEAQQLNIEVKANVKFSVEVDEACKKWVKYNTTKGLTTSTVVLDISKNESYDGREGKVTIKQTDGNITETVIIKQGQLDGLFLTTSEYNLSDEQHTLTVEVKSNIDFEVKPEVDWIKYVETKGLKTNQIILNVAANDTYDEREGKVTVKQKNGNLTGTIVIRQDENYGILVSQSAYELSNEAQTIEVEVKYNVDFDVVIPSGCKDWIKQVSTKSLNSRTYTFSIAKNGTYDNREGSITFKQKKGDISTTVSIKQAQTDYLEVAKKEYLVDVEGETVKIEVTSNVDYTVTIDESAKDWLKIVETKGLSKGIVSIAVSPGNDDTDRTGKVIISYGELSHTVSIHQCTAIIQFADEKIKEKLVAAFDTNNDGELSLKEARAVKSIEGVFGAIKTYKSFDEFQYFTGVTDVPEGMFADWNLITSIILPESVRTIKQHAFNNCVKLSSIGLSKGITSIGWNAFYGCNNLKRVDITDLSAWYNISFASALSNPLYYAHRLYLFGNEVNSIDTTNNSVTIISPYAFIGCTSLTSIAIPENVTSIGNHAFDGCSCLSSIMIPQTVSSIGEDAFNACAGLKGVDITDLSAWYNISFASALSNPLYYAHRLYINKTEVSSIEIPTSVTHIGDYAFYGCSSLASVVIPDNLIIGNCAFKGCSNLSSIVIPDSVTKIGKGAFYDIGDPVELTTCLSWGILSTFINANSIHLNISEGVTNIHNGSFSGCTSLSSVVIPESVSDIREGAFRGCTSLSSVVIPESVTRINSSAFYGCISLSSVVIPESVTRIDGYTFYGCTSLSSVVIPNSVTSIGGEAFYGCTSLTSVAIPESVSSIGERSFARCFSLNRVEITDISFWYHIKFASGEANPLYCAHRLFLNGVEITSLEIPNSVTSIEDFAFNGCTGLISIVIPETVTSIGANCFEGCTSLSSVIIPKSITSIGTSTFQGCISLKSIDIPNSVTSIGNRAFSDCTGLTTLTIPTSVTSIGDYAFYGCSNLSSLVIPDSVTKIGKGAFYDIGDPVELTTCLSWGILSTFINANSIHLNISESVTTIPNSAFSSCWGLKSVVIPKSVTWIGWEAFYNCTGLRSVTVMSETPPQLAGGVSQDVFYYLHTQTHVRLNMEIYVPKNSVDAYKTAAGWSQYASKIQAIPD